MGRVVALTLLAFALAPLHAAPQSTRSSTKKVTVATGGHKSLAGRRSSSVSAHVVTTSRSHRASVSRSVRGRTTKPVRVVRAVPAPSYQLHPDPDRYQQIQRALVDRGYFKGEPNGEWGDDSGDAMRRFQADQKIDNDGKIDALSLIALGLGPKHDGTTSATLIVAPVPTNATPPSAQTVPPASPAGIAVAPPH